MRVKFSKTLRRHMRDPAVFSARNIWTDADNELANAILKFARENPACVTEDDFTEAFTAQHPLRGSHATQAMYARLHDFPHIFELAAARRDVNSYDLHGRK